MAFGETDFNAADRDIRAPDRILYIRSVEYKTQAPNAQRESRQALLLHLHGGGRRASIRAADVLIYCISRIVAARDRGRRRCGPINRRHTL
jgi:hypothetical protein